MSKMSIRRLLNRRAATDYLDRFTKLIPNVRLALIEHSGRAVVDIGAAEAAPPVSDVAWDHVQPLEVEGQHVGRLVAAGEGLSDPQADAALDILHQSLVMMMKRAFESRTLAQETLERYREINLLYNIGETISASLDPDVIPNLVLAEAARVIHADGGVVLLLSYALDPEVREDIEALEEQIYQLSVESDFGDKGFTNIMHTATLSLMVEALASGDAYIWAADQFDYKTDLVGSVLVAPLKARERILGFVLLGRDPQEPIFTADDVKLLTALAAQAAVAVENARLFADVINQRDAIAAMNNYMDNIFASIASGVITINAEDLITLMNNAAEQILGVPAEETMGKPYLEALPEMGPNFVSLVDVIKHKDKSVVGYEMEPVLPDRGQVVLRLNLSPLKDNRKRNNGVAIVLDDLTERRQLEAQMQQIRQTFEQYVVPHVVEQLLSDPTSVRLGGVRRAVTILFADIRGFTSFSEKLQPEASVEVLNRYLTLASEAVLAEEGTLDKFLGDGVMAIYNAPLAQPDHALRAVRSALAVQKAVREMHNELPPANCLHFGVGITSGLAVVGSIGSTKIRNYTAIGDTVNLASRLQAQAEPGQVLLDKAAYEYVKDRIIARELGYVQVKGHSEPDLVFEVVGLEDL